MGIVYASIILACEIGLGLNGRKVFVIYIVSAVIIFVGAISVNIIYNVVYIKKIQKLLLLFDEGKFDECIDKLNDIEKKLTSGVPTKMRLAFSYKTAFENGIPSVIKLVRVNADRNDISYAPDGNFRINLEFRDLDVVWK